MSVAAGAVVSSQDGAIYQSVLAVAHGRAINFFSLILVSAIVSFKTQCNVYFSG